MEDRSGSTSNNDDITKGLVDSNTRMEKEMEYLKSRLNALEMHQQQPPPSNQSNGAATAVNDGNAANVATEKRGGDDSTDERAKKNATKRGITWRDSLDISSDHRAAAATDNDGGVQGNNNNPPPVRKIKFLDLSPPSNDTVRNTNDNTNANRGDDNDNNEDNGSSDGSDSSSSSSSTDDDDCVAFSGWARVFFQARHHRSATQVTSGAMSTTAQDTYLHLSIHSTANELRVSSTDEPKNPPLIDPPIPLKYFHAVKVPGSRSGAALFLRNDSRRLRKYVFRFEFVNRAVRQDPARYLQFLRSGKAAKRSVRGMNKMRNAFNKIGEERKESMKEDKRRAQDAFAAHLGALDELLRESDESADRFVECVNARNEEEELQLNNKNNAARGGGGSDVMMGDSDIGRRKRSRPPPPYWGSGFNRPSVNDEDDHVDSESSYSGEEDELDYDDDNDDETFFDKVQVSTEQTLETLFNHIVK